MVVWFKDLFGSAPVSAGVTVNPIVVNATPSVELTLALTRLKAIRSHVLQVEEAGKTVTATRAFEYFQETVKHLGLLRQHNWVTDEEAKEKIAFVQKRMH